MIAEINMDKTEAARLAILHMDLTSVNQEDTEGKIKALCKHATTAYGNVAAVCVLPKFISVARSNLESSETLVATVVNFPGGDFSPQEIENQLFAASDADEIDIVFPYNRLKQGDTITALQILKRVRELTPNKTLKVILESGELAETELEQACEISLEAGTDFLKTSTGKTQVGATTGAAQMMLSKIRDHQQRTGRKVGFKASGGIRTLDQAIPYLELASQFFGNEYINRATFRIGASSLLESCKQVCAEGTTICK